MDTKNELEVTNSNIIDFIKSKATIDGKCPDSPIDFPTSPVSTKTSVRKRARPPIVEHLPLASPKNNVKAPCSKKRKTSIPIDPPANQLEPIYPSEEEKNAFLTKLQNLSSAMIEFITFTQKHGTILSKQKPHCINNCIPAIQPITRNALITLRILMAPIQKVHFQQKWGFDIDSFQKQLLQLASLSAPIHALISDIALRDHFSI